MSRFDMLRISPLLIMLLLSVALSLGLFSRGQQEPIDRINNGKHFSDFEVQSLGKDTMFSPKLFGRQVIVVNVFASWCAACVAEHSLLMGLAKKVNIYGVAWKDKPEDTLRYLQKNGNPFQQIGVDESGKTTIPMFLTGVPETFVLNKKGEIAFHYRSAITQDVVNSLILPKIRQLNSEN